MNENFKSPRVTEIQERMAIEELKRIKTEAIKSIAVIAIMAVAVLGIISTTAQAQQTFHPGDILSADQLNGMSFQLQSLTKRVDSLEAKVEKLTRVALKNNVRVQKLEKK